MTSRIFTLQDQQAFAALSGDHNPLHVDVLAARRTLFGRPVVHGIHLLLWALSVALPGPARLARLRVGFQSPVGVGEQVALTVARPADDRLDIQLDGLAGRAVTVKAELLPFIADEGVADAVPGMGTCTQWSPGAPDQGECRGGVRLALDRREAALLLPGLTDRLPAGQIALLLASTYIIGMECPGLDSIYAALDLRFDAPAGPVALDWRLEQFEERFAQVELAVGGYGAMGTLTAFIRPQPQGQPASGTLRPHVAPGAYAGRRALVIGGGRGIGEVGAKMLGLGGADVRITWHRGREDAARVVADIRSSGGTADSFHLDVLSPAEGLAGTVGDGWFPTHIYYFATPPIFVAGKARFNEAIAASFMDVYVHGLSRTHQALRAINAKAPLHLHYPSSVAVDELPLSMGEYAVAKTAGEALCRFLAKADRFLSVRIDRLPRLPTDQTANLQDIPTADMVETLSAILAA
ncbi:MaoC/PaaZ C-terminal domain-containing protein [Niveispirillum sp. KHB5.9]|uniref:MaoC/PaaZ C-terminal domain-containing protein n=1 Tax=Niveispirillum sp. KHB5.9 TaxID=3400269 RepID=UPI003A86357F